MTVIESLAAVSSVLLASKNAAVDARKKSGFEDLWQSLENRYLGDDGATAPRITERRWIKGPTMDSPLTLERASAAPQTYSTIYPPMTRRYVDAGAAKVCEIALPLDDKPFSIDATPVPDAEALKDSEQQVVLDGQPLMRAGDPAYGEDQSPKPLQVQDVVEEAQQREVKKAKKAERQIHDWQIEAGHAEQMRKVIFDAALLGVGILKGPVAIRKTGMTFSLAKSGGTATLEKIEKIIPGTQWVDPWNFFPSQWCGEEIDDSDMIWERGYLTARQLKALARERGYHTGCIEAVLSQGPNKEYREAPREWGEADDNERYTVWYGSGVLPKEAYEAIRDSADTSQIDAASVSVMVTLVNDLAIKAVLNPLEVSGSLNYYAFSWTRRPGSWVGVGVAEQCEVPDILVKQATRVLLDNAGSSAGYQLIVDRNKIEPADGSWNFSRFKVWWAKAGEVQDDVRKAITAIQFPSTQPQLMAIIQYGMRMFEEVTSIPLVTQGQSGPTQHDTARGIELQDNNANQLLRQIGRRLDEAITKPLIQRYYEWYLLDPDVPDSDKGDFLIHAKGTSAAVERSIQKQFLAQFGGFALNPASGIDPKKWGAEMCRHNNFDIRAIQYSEADLAKLQAQSEKQAPPPQVMVAQIRAEIDKYKADLQAQVDQVRIQRDTDRDTVYVQAETERTRAENETKMVELSLKREIEMLKYATQRQISVESAKVELAKATMELRTQKELAGVDGRGPQVVRPANEPPGRAPNGEAFQR